MHIILKMINYRNGHLFSTLKNQFEFAVLKLNIAKKKERERN